MDKKEQFYRTFCFKPKEPIKCDICLKEQEEVLQIEFDKEAPYFYICRDCWYKGEE